MSDLQRLAREAHERALEEVQAEGIARAQEVLRTLGSDPAEDLLIMRSFRVPAVVWRAAQARGQAEGVAMSEVIRRALEEYVKGPRP